ncbi:MAG: hypothetical protein WCT23_10150 [Candidatus Neomarinimicrobiota bacterium]
MQGKNIKKHIKNKIKDWADSVQDEEIKNLILNNTMVTGGAIVSLLQDEEPHDYDIYFRDKESLKKVATYYVNKYIEKAGEKGNYQPIVQECFWSEKPHWNNEFNTKGRWVVINDNLKQEVKDEINQEEIRLRIFIKSNGAVGEEYNPHSDIDEDYKRACAILNQKIKENNKTSKENIEPYSPTFMTNNAITLSSKIQVVMRFYGEPEDIHKNYDFVHCTCCYRSWDNELDMPARALEAIINKELYYVGSKYPLCSVIRTRKFINRGWVINAGQYVKMVLQLNDMDLTNLHVFEEQLIGVDSAYFGHLIWCIKQEKKNDPNFNPDSTYLIKLVNDVFDKEF